MKKLLAATTLLFLASTGVLAQSSTLPIDTTSGPSFLNAGFPNYPDPQIAGMLAGGGIDAATLNLGPDCIGNIYEVPDALVELTSGVDNLRAYFTTVDGGDTSLVVHRPDGSFVCSNDAVGLDPMVNIPSAGIGEYRFWVGVVGSTEFIPGYIVITAGASLPGALDVPQLYSSIVANGQIAAQPTPGGLSFDNIFGSLNTETPAVTPDILPSPEPSPTQAPVINVQTPTHPGMSVSAAPMPAALNTAASFYGRGALAAGFDPDPEVINMSAGGALDAASLTIGRRCQGFINNQPEYIIDYAGGGALLRLFFVGDSDATLMIAGPGNVWYCSDQFNAASSPLVDILNPPAGQYAIWVGTRVVDTFVGGDLYVTALDTVDPTTLPPADE